MMMIAAFSFAAGVAAGVISSGFSALTGIEISSPIPRPVYQSRRCSNCGCEPCLDHEICAGLRTANLIFRDVWHLATTAQPRNENRAQAAQGAVPEADMGPQAAPAPPEVIKLSVKDLFNLTAMAMAPPAAAAAAADNEESVTVHVHMLKSNNSLRVDVNSNSTIEDLRREAAAKLDLPPKNLMLILNGSQLEDHEEIRYLGIITHSAIYGFKCSPGRQMVIFELDPSTLDPRYNHDFTGESDDGKTYMRGGHVYQRPYGWKRYAVKVLGEYEDDTWLGEKNRGIRTRSTPGEWAVSYHGTGKGSVKPILEEGYRIPGPRAHYEPAVYSSPSLEKVADHYAKTFEYEGKQYQLVLQNRVDPDNLEVVPPSRCVGRFPYWKSPVQDPDRGVYHVRPYGVLTREIQ